MADFVALYRGDKPETARLIAVTTERAVVRDFAARLLASPDTGRQKDPVIRELDDGRKRALRAVLADGEQEKG